MKEEEEEELIMKGIMVCLTVCLMVFVLSGSVFAETDPVQTLAKGCEKEITTYCKDVTPGQGRILACLYAYGDKLSGRCEYALYDAAVQLERAVAALSYVANECKADLSQYCSGVAVGEGRLLKCLQEHDEKVSDRCKQARKDVGLK
jgi:hypothetical protein